MGQLRRSVLLLACVACLAAVEPARLVAILGEAERLGFPSLQGAALMRGSMLPMGERWDWMRGNLARGAGIHVHARLADGSWLVDLAVPVAASGADMDDLATLQAAVPGDVAQMGPPAWPGIDRNTDLLIAARWIQAGLGAPDAAVAAYEMRTADVFRDHRRRSAWPRRPVASDPEDALRWALVGWFLGEGQGAAPARPEAAIAIAPAAHRESLTQEMARRTQPATVSTDDLAAISRWQSDAKAAPAIDEARLIAAAGVASPADGAARDGMAIGDRALAILDRRWGIDPVACVGRSTVAPWTDAERSAVAEALGRWWAADPGMPLPQRLGRGLAGAPPDEILIALRNRASRTRERNEAIHTDQVEVEQALVAALGERWREAPPPMRPETLHALLNLAQDRGGIALCAAADGWRSEPWSHEALAVWGERRGRPQGVDALVEAWLLQPDTDSPLLSAQAWAFRRRGAGERPAGTTPLTWWVCRADAARWTRLTAILAGDPASSRATARLLAGVGGHWPGNGFPVSPALAWLALADCRPATAALAALAGPRAATLRRGTNGEVRFTPAPPGPDPGGLRICDIVALEIAAYPYPSLGWQGAKNLASTTPKLFAGLLAAAPAERDSAIASLRAGVAGQAHECLTYARLPIPEGLTPPPVEPSEPEAVVPAVAPGLSQAEAAACREVLAEAVALGFPDLAGASVTIGELVRGGGGSWFGPHIHLADGSWLADGLVPIPAERVRSSGEPAPVPTSAGRQSWPRLDPLATARVTVNDRLGKLGERPETCGIAALAWWLGGTDPEGRGIIAAAAVSESADVDVPGRMTIAVMVHTSAGEGLPVVLPDPATAVRRTCARWFRERLRIARDAAEARRWHAAAGGILAPADRATWAGILDALLAVRDIPAAVASDPLERRLAAWSEAGRDLWDGQWEGEAPRLQATRSDLDGLVALLGDTRPCRWIDDGIPRTLGDNALRALAKLTGVDWRWIVLDQPAVAAVAPPPEQKHGGDCYRWHRWAWTAAQRTAVAAALQAWWSAHREAGAAGAAAAVIARMPLAQWDDVLRHLPGDLEGDLTGAAVAQVLAAWTPPARGRVEYGDGSREAILAALRWHRHPAVTVAVAGWPAAPWRDRLLQLRDQLGGGRGFDPSIAAWLRGELPVPNENGTGWDWRAYLDPARNLGLWAHALSVERLAAMRACLAGPLEDGPALWLIAKLGYGRMEVCGSWNETDRFTTGRTAPYAGPAALVLTGLDDRRVVPPASLPRLAACAAFRNGEVGTAIPGLRVCDWVAHQLMEGHERLGLEVLPDGADRQQDFRAADLAGRDRQIAILRAAFAPEVERQLIEAGLQPAKPDPGPGF